MKNLNISLINTNSVSFRIKRVETMDEIHGIVEIQRQAWQMDDLGIVPTFEMKAVASVGTVLVALDENDTAIGFIYAYDQLPDAHYSHMMAVLPEWHGKSIGYELKKVHFKIARENNIKHIRWTVDPLLPNNAYLNFAKLGGICNEYYVDYYGSPDAEGISIYAGLDTDRFLLDWRINDERVGRRMDNYKLDRITEDALFKKCNPVNTIENNLPKAIDGLMEQSTAFIVQIPSDFQQIREQEQDKAKVWRSFFREICLEYFKKGWYVLDYHSFNREKNYYEFGKLNG